ncbi:MAG: Beta-hexosaminidase [Chlamydiae bacterium]|nr:Beta-hexosaminidase [Chlamydiota bacterium]
MKFLICCLFFGCLFAHVPEFLEPKYVDLAKKEVASLSIKEKVARLFFAPCFSENNDFYLEDLKALIQEKQIGGVLFSRGTVVAQKKLIDTFDNLSNHSLIYALDAEWGVAMRLNDMPGFPRNMTLGAIQDESLLFEVGKKIGQQCVCAGVHFNFAPVLDVNNNPKNPIIHMRSFGDRPLDVARRGTLLFQGMQTKGVLAFGKHFCGHGDTHIDSHEDLPVLDFDRERLNQTELVPFKAAIDQGIGGMMIGHLKVPVIDSKFPTSLSEKALNLLKKELGFEGLVITDALNMKAIVNQYGLLEAALIAYQAGCDLFCYLVLDQEKLKQMICEVIPQSIDLIAQKIEEKVLLEEELDEKVIKLIACQKWMENKRKAVDPKKNDTYMIQMLYDKAMTYLGDPQNLMLDPHEKLQLVSLGEAKTKTLQTCLDRHMLLEEKTLENLDPNQKTLCVLYKMDKNDPDLQKLKNLKNTLFIVFDTPYLLQHFTKDQNVLLCYEETIFSQNSAYKALMGVLFPQGKLPVEVFFSQP